MRQSGKKPKFTFCPISEVKELQFSVISSEDIETLSVAEITENKVYESGEIVKGGPNDLRLGISSGNTRCQTCSQGFECQGHFGHIKLDTPIFHYGFIKQIEKILKCICHNCFRVKRPKDSKQRKKFEQISRLENNKEKLGYMAKLLANQRVCNQIEVGDQGMSQLFIKFKGCGFKNPTKIALKNYQIHYQSSSRETSKIPKCFSREYVKNALQCLSMYKNQCELIGFTVTKPINLMINNLLVVPPQIRPQVEMNNEISCEDDITFTYCKIISLNKRLVNEKNKLVEFEKNQLIQDIEHLTGTIMFKIDSASINRSRTKNMKKKKKIHNFKAISQRLQGKQGRFRQNLMGKRVDFSARTVISPDPSLDLDQLGIPVKIARKLTYPEQINQLNYEKIINLCLQGRIKTLIEPPEHSLQNQNRVINIEKLLGLSRQQIEKYVNYGMIAERTLENGDYVMLNRQPTLHRMSMMGHRIRILPYNTFRLNLSVCTPYNADFDGDQMNIHVPQGYQSLTEIKKISNVSNQIVAPKNSAPIMGIVQDALLGVFLMTIRDTFLTRQEMMNLLMWIQPLHRESQSNIYNFPLPTILVPEALWTGKQVISMIIPKNLSIKHIKNKNQGNSNVSDGNLLIKQGQLLLGNLLKDVMGPGAGSLIHWIWLQSSRETAMNFITNCQKIVNNWMIQNSFSVGASDILPKQSLRELHLKEKTNINKLYHRILAKYKNKHDIQQQGLHQKGRSILQTFEFNINAQLNNRLSKGNEYIKANMCPKSNNIYRIVEAKSKGSETNLTQILFSVGNQNINGMRCPLGFSRRALPHFSKNDQSPESRGYVHSSFYTGLKPHEFFFHSMGGRQGLSDTAVKTSHVGYLQRKLVKTLEDIVVNYDGTVRDCKDNLLQKSYGQDGFLPEYLQKHRIVSSEMGKQAFRKRYKWEQKQLISLYNYTSSQISKLKPQYSILYHYRKRLRKIYINDTTTIQYFCPIKVDRLINKINNEANLKTSNQYEQNYYESIDPLQIFENVERIINECVPPLATHIDQYFKTRISTEIFNDDDSMSEDQEKLIQPSFIKSNPNRGYKQKHADSVEQQLGLEVFRIHLRYNLSSRNLIKKHKISRTCFNMLLKEIKKKFYQALAPAGQAVGSIAAQSIGQPTTQMTLNTFHLAGVSDKNVTLGLPRLQQLLDISPNIKTPSMTIFPTRKITFHQRSTLQNQLYLIDHLTYQLPQRKVSDFLDSSKLTYSVSNKCKEDEEDEGLKIDRNTPWGIILFFNAKKLNSKKYWIEIVRKIQKFIRDVNATKIIKGHKGQYKLIERKEFNGGMQEIQNPQLFIRYLQNDYSVKEIGNIQTGQNLETGDRNNQKKERSEVRAHNRNLTHIFDDLLKLEGQLRQLFICGIQGIKGAKTSKKTILDIPKSHPLTLYGNNETLRTNHEIIVFQTDGSNLKACLSHLLINPHKTYTNDIQEIYQVLGIEAARQAFINQLKEILVPYGIFINFRHLTVLVDWICMRGKMTAVNRHGLNKASDISICKKASYEQTSKVLLESAVYSQRDYLRGASQRIMFGQTVRSGSTMSEVLLDLDKLEDYVSKADFCKNNVPDFNNQQVVNNNTPIYNSVINDSFHHNTLSHNYKSGLMTPQAIFSPSIPSHMQFKKSPSYPMNISYNQKNLTQSSLLSDLNPRNTSMISPTYLSKSNSLLSSSILSSSLSFGYGGCSDYSNKSFVKPSPMYSNPSPMYSKKIGQVSKVEQDEENEEYEDYEDF